jgi:hypothetical protein
MAKRLHNNITIIIKIQYCKGLPRGSRASQSCSWLGGGSGGYLRLKGGSEMNLQNNPTEPHLLGQGLAALRNAPLGLGAGSALAARHKLWASGLLEVRQVSQQHRGIHLDLTLQRLNVSRVHAMALKPVSKEGG